MTYRQESTCIFIFTDVKSASGIQGFVVYRKNLNLIGFNRTDLRFNGLLKAY